MSATQTLDYASNRGERPTIWTFTRQSARAALLLAIFSALSLFLPERRFDYEAPTMSQVISEMLRVYEDEFHRWALNELERREHLRGELSGSPPGFVTPRTLPPSLLPVMSSAYRIHLLLLLATIILGTVALWRDAARLALFTWSILLIGSAILLVALLAFSWVGFTRQPILLALALQTFVVCYSVKKIVALRKYRQSVNEN